MFLALALLLIQPQVAPQITFSAKKIALIDSIHSAPSSDLLSLAEVALPLASADPGIAVQPTINLVSAALPDAPEAAPVTTPVEIAFLKPAKPGTVSVSALQAEERRNQRVWMGLGIAAHSAATFDAWSTRHAITTEGAHELNPMLKPFAGNASLYAAIQVGPVVMDYLGKKLMYNRHSWVRRMWWIPQSASFASSMFCGAHNLTVH